MNQTYTINLIQRGGSNPRHGPSSIILEPDPRFGGCLDDTLYTNRNSNRTLEQNETTFDVNLSDISLDDEPCYAGPSDRLKRAEDKEGVDNIAACTSRPISRMESITQFSKAVYIGLSDEIGTASEVRFRRDTLDTSLDISNCLFHK